MTQEEFQQLWTLNYPDTVPISHLFKHDYADRWFRIHSLPESKRYADNDAEWEVLLSRQNELMTDLLGADGPVFLVTGDYCGRDEEETQPRSREEVFKRYAFTRLDAIDVFKLDLLLHEEVEIYKPAYAPTIWKQGGHDELLREIADDNARAFFVSFDKQVIIAPYDGGIDVVVKDSATKEHYKAKYRDWLSDREDGL